MTEEHLTRATQENHAFALMGRLHVTLRRQTGRVTDIEYMRIDQSYCRYLLKMTAESDNPDLREISAKLKEIFFGTDGLFVLPEPRQPLLSRQAEPVETPASQSSTKSSAPAAGDDDAVDRGYIGRLR
jgi:hypothetical protein